MKKNMLVFITIAVAMIAFVGCANCTYDEKLDACIKDLPEDEDKTDDAKTDDEKSDTDTVEGPKQGEEGGKCFANKSCMEGLECVKVNEDYICIVAEEVDDDLASDDDEETDDETSDDDTVDPDLGKEGHGCYSNNTCDEGLVCDQASENDIDICVKVVGVVGEKNGSCKVDRTCNNTGLVCFRENFLCNDMPTVGARTVCWSRELNTSPKQDSCSAKGGIAPAVFEYVIGVKTPDCVGLYNVDPEFECVRINATVESFRNSTETERNNLNLTSSFYLPPIN